MPQGSNRPLGIASKEVLANAGGEQFFLSIDAAGPPVEITISYARLSDGTEFAGVTGYTGAPWTNGVINYVWYRLSTDSIEDGTLGFPDEPDVIPLWQLDINGAGVLNAVLDSRPWFDGGAGGGANSSEERLKEILQHSVMEDLLYDALESTDNLDGNSNGTFLGPNRYQLDAGEYFYTNFASAPPDHLALINQPYVAVLTDQLVDETTEIEVWVSRVASPGNPFPGPNANWVQAPANFSLVDLTAAPGADVLNIAVRNISGGTYEVVGWGIYSNPTTAPGGVIVPKTGLHVGGTGLDVYNTNPAAYKTSAADFAFTWDAIAAGGTLSWAGTGVGDDLVVEISDDLLGTIERNLVIPGSIAGVTAGSYVYFDIDRDDPPNTALVAQVSAGPPVMVKDRFILGKRIPDPNGGNDQFVLWNNHLLEEVNTTPIAANLRAPPPLFPQNMLAGLFSANAPTGANPYATIADLAGLSGGLKSLNLAGTTLISTDFLAVSTTGVTEILGLFSRGGAEVAGYFRINVGSNSILRLGGSSEVISGALNTTLVNGNISPDRIYVRISGSSYIFRSEGSAVNRCEVMIAAF